jgi:hypothetical protein
MGTLFVAVPLLADRLAAVLARRCSPSKTAHDALPRYMRAGTHGGDGGGFSRRDTSRQGRFYQLEASKNESVGLDEAPS